MTVEAGREAPEFSLPSKPGEEPVRLSDFRGKKSVVLLFFPLAWTSVCTGEMCTTRDDYDKYAELDAEVLGISVDSPFALQAWAREQDIPFPLLSDFNREASRRWDVLYEDLMGLRGVAKRAAFVVDRDGVVRYAEVCPSPGELPDLEAVRETLRQLA